MKNPVNCWELPSGQSAAKPRNGKVQRPFRKEVGSSDPKRRAPRTGDEMVFSLQQCKAVRKDGLVLAQLTENKGFASDFGNLSVVTDRFQRERDAFLIDPEYWKVAYLRNFQVSEIGKTADAQTKFLVCEMGLESTQEAASGGIFDLTTS